MQAVVVCDTEACSHDEEVFVVVPQDGVSGGGIVEVVGFEGGRDPRHVDIVEVDQVEFVVDVPVCVGPSVSPCGRE